MNDYIYQFIEESKQDWERSPWWKQDNFPATVVQLIQMCPVEHIGDFSLEWCAQQLDVTGSYISRRVSEYFQRTFRSHLTQRKMLLAKDLLADAPKLSIEDIAQKLGYCNANYFIKVFKKHQGGTPLRFRKTLQQVEALPIQMSKLAFKIEDALRWELLEATEGKLDQAVSVHHGKKGRTKTQK